MAELSGADAVHHRAECRSVEILAGKAGITKNFGVVDAVEVCQLAQVAFLQRQAVFICLHIGRYTDIQCGFWGLGYSNSMFSHNTRLLSRVVVVRAVYNML